MIMLQRGGRHFRQMAALAVASTFLAQNFAWAVCSDGLGMPAGQGGYVFGNLPPQLQNMSPAMFTNTAGSVFVPDNTTCEFNDCANQPTTTANTSGITLITTVAGGNAAVAVGGHNWDFDQGSDTCKAVDTGPAGQPATGWSIAPNTSTDCPLLPIIKGGVFQNLGDIPYQSQAIVPTCDPTALSGVVVNGVLTPQPNPRNTRLNQIGCSIAQLFFGFFKPLDQTTATAWLFVAGIKGGLFAEQLENTPNTTTGDAGRVISGIRYYSDIPEGSKLTNASISNDGHFALVSSLRRNPNVFGCNMPLGDGGRIDNPPIDIQTFSNSFDPSTSNPNGVKCLSSIANMQLQVTLTSIFGPDNQWYAGGQRTVTTFGGSPGSIFQTSAWPQCIVNGKGQLITLPAVYPTDPVVGTFGNYDNVAQLDAAINLIFHQHSNGGCGNMQPNSGWVSNALIQPLTFAAYTAANGNRYMFSSGTGQPTFQARLNENADGTTNYHIREYASGGTGFVTGIGVAPDMSWGFVNNTANQPPNGLTTGSGSLIIMQDPSGTGLAAQEVMTRVPLCEDF
jgi:hypothetical protein